MDLNRKILNIRLLSTMLLVMCALILSAQDSADLYVNGTVKDYFSRKKISGVKVKVLQDGQNFESLVTSSNGKYEFFLPLDHDYQIIFEKDGMVTKRIAIDSRGIPEEDRRGGFAMNPDMSLFDNIDGIDFSMLDQPIGKGKYDPERGNIEFDVAYTQRIQSEIMRLMREVERANDEAAKEADKEAEALAKLEEDFAKFMADGRNEMTKKSYEKAVDAFQGAVGLKPDDPEAKAALADAQKALDEQLAAEERDSKYNDFIDRGDAAFDSKNWEDAVNAYNEASQVKPDERYPKDQIAKAEAELEKERQRAADEAAVASLIKEGDDAMASESFDTAISKYEEALSIIPGNQEAKDKLDEAREAKAQFEASAAERALYDATIAKADGLFDKEDYAASIPEYEAASKIFPDEAYPKDRIAEAQTRIEQLEAEAAAAAELADKQAEFDRLMSEADANRAKQAFDEAIGGYEDALKIFPDDSDSAKKLEDTKNEKDAYLAAQEADERYQSLISEADKLFTAEDWEASIPIYQEASQVKDEVYPKEQIAEAERLIEEKRLKEEEEARLAAEAAELAEKQAAYDELIADGQKAMDKEEFEEAIDDFTKALDIFPDDEAAQEAKGLAEEALANALALAAEAEALAAKQAEYDQHMADGESAFKKESYDEAISAYERALRVFPDDSEALAAKERAETARADMLAQMEEDARREAEEAAAAAKQAEYDGFMAEGRSSFDAEDYEDAIQAFQNALSVFSDDLEAQEMIARAEKARDEKLAADEAARLAAEADAAEAEKMERYQDAMSRAEGSMESESFEEAISAYEEALGVIPGDKPATRGKEEAEKALEDYLARLADEEARQAELAAMEAEAAEEKALRDRFNKLVSQGDAAMAVETFEPAVDNYEQALEIFPEDGPTQRKLEKAIKALDDAAARKAADEAARLAEEERLAELEAERLLAEAEEDKRRRQEELDREYDEAIREGDRALAQKSYLEARTYYEDAQEIKPDESYPPAQIEKIALLIEQAEEEERLRKEREAQAEALAAERGFRKGDDLKDSREQELDEEMRRAREEALRAKWDAMTSDKEAWNESRGQMKDEAGYRVEENEELVQGYRERLREDRQRFNEEASERAEDMMGYKEGLAAQRERVVDRGDSRRSDARENSMEIAEDRKRMTEAYYTSGEHYQDHLKKVSDYQRFKEDMIEDGLALQEDRAEESSKNKQEVLKTMSEFQGDGAERTEEYAEEILKTKEDIQEYRAERNAETKEDNTRWIENLKEDQVILQERLRESSDDTRASNLDEVRSKETYRKEKGPMDVAQTDLAKEFPQGVTEEVYEEGNKSVIRRIVVVGNKANEYHKVQSISGTYYFKNGRSITEHLWRLESDKVLE